MPQRADIRCVIFMARLVIAAGSRITSDFALLAQRTDFQYLFGNRYGEMAGSINTVANPRSPLKFARARSWSCIIRHPYCRISPTKPPEPVCALSYAD